MPAPLRDRQADNWRPLIAIADPFGADWALRAREAAVLCAGQHQDEDAAVVLLRDIRDIFDGRGVDRLPSKAMVDHLTGADDAAWSEWRGIDGNQQPHKLSPGELAKLLVPFQIRPRTIRIFANVAGKPTLKGYYRAQFEAAWRSYCPDEASRHIETDSWVTISDALALSTLTQVSINYFRPRLVNGASGSRSETPDAK
jgi:hypothetical protein